MQKYVLFIISLIAATHHSTNPTILDEWKVSDEKIYKDSFTSFNKTYTMYRKGTIQCTRKREIKNGSPITIFSACDLDKETIFDTQFSEKYCDLFMFLKHQYQQQKNQ